MFYSVFIKIPWVSGNQRKAVISSKTQESTVLRLFSSHLSFVELQGLHPDGKLFLQSGQRALQDALFFFQLLHNQQLGVHLREGGTG